MKVLVLSCAEAELAEAVDYYNGQCPGLGYEFAAEVQRTFARICRHPAAWPVFSARARRCLTDRFPFGVLYQVRADGILVAGIMHLKRDPQRWQERLKQALGEPPAGPDAAGRESQRRRERPPLAANGARRRPRVPRKPRATS